MSAHSWALLAVVLYLLCVAFVVVLTTGRHRRAFTLPQSLAVAALQLALIAGVVTTWPR